MAEVAVQTKPTIALDDATLGRIAALWTAAFPTAEGRDRCAEAIERRATTAATDEEQLHYVEDGEEVVAAARTVRATAEARGVRALTIAPRPIR